MQFITAFTMTVVEMKNPLVKYTGSDVLQARKLQMQATACG